MRARTVLLIALAGVLLPAVVQAAETDEGEADGSDAIVLHLRAHDVGRENWFQMRGDDTRNPALELPPGSNVTVHVQNVGNTEHNLRFDAPIGKATPMLQPGENATLTFTVPEDATGKSLYWCDPHRSVTMQGRVVFTDAQVPAFGVPAALGAGVVALLALGARVRGRK